MLEVRCRGDRRWLVRVRYLEEHWRARGVHWLEEARCSEARWRAEACWLVEVAEEESFHRHAES